MNSSIKKMKKKESSVWRLRTYKWFSVANETSSLMNELTFGKFLCTLKVHSLLLFLKVLTSARLSSATYWFLMKCERAIFCLTGFTLRPSLCWKSTRPWSCSSSTLKPASIMYVPSVSHHSRTPSRPKHLQLINNSQTRYLASMHPVLSVSYQLQKCILVLFGDVYTEIWIGRESQPTWGAGVK